MNKKGLTLEEAFKVLNGRLKVDESEKTVKKDIDTEIKIPAPWNKYYVVSDYNPNDELAASGEYRIGEKIENYDMHFMGYLDPKPGYEDVLDEPYAVLTDDPDCPVCVIVGGRVYSVPADSLMKKN